MKKKFMITISIVFVLVVFGVLFMQQPVFGKYPNKKELERVEKSPNYEDGKFKNLSVTPSLTEGVGYMSVMYEFLFVKKENLKPVGIIPSQNTDIKNINQDKDVLIWFGHSSYFIQMDGVKFLVDPVFSGHASPFSFTTKSFNGSDVYNADDMPFIDYLLISHDHYDHLDHKTVKELMPKVGKVICGLGVGSHFKRWGYNENLITETDWGEKTELNGNMIIHTTPARHFSGRGFIQNKTLWVSFVLQTKAKNIFIGGDGGYDEHFKEIGNEFGSIDLAILENGQYDKNWKYIHLHPEEVLQAARDLNASKLFPVHSGKFAIANHPWNEPLNRISALCEGDSIDLITPLIGQEVSLDESGKKYKYWWKEVK